MSLFRKRCSGALGATRTIIRPDLTGSKASVHFRHMNTRCPCLIALRPFNETKLCSLTVSVRRLHFAFPLVKPAATECPLLEKDAPLSLPFPLMSSALGSLSAAAALLSI